MKVKKKKTIEQTKLMLHLYLLNKHVFKKSPELSIFEWCVFSFFDSRY